MAKYNTAIKGYYQGASQIEQFVRSEIGTEKNIRTISIKRDRV